MYAIVRAGGRQEKVAVGDVLTIDRIRGEVGSTVELEPLMLVDGEKITTDAQALTKLKVTGEIVEVDRKGPKITIVNYKNKTGYRRRMGFRSKMTQIKITKIS